MDTSQYRDLFVRETNIHLAKIEELLLSLETDPLNRASIDALFRHYHSIKGMCASMGYEVLKEFAHAQEDLVAKFRAGEATPGEEAMSLLLESLDAMKEMISCVSEGLPLSVDPDPFIGLLKNLVSRIGIEAAPPEASVSKTAGLSAPVLRVASAMKVEASVFDNLLRLTGDMTTLYLRLRRLASEAGEVEIKEGAHLLGKTLSEMRAGVIGARMLPFEHLTHALPRIVRDIAKSQGKEVSFTVTGGDISLDRNTLDGMGDPLIHMIRNAVDHGIETPAERVAAGKSEAGRITVGASGDKDRVVIEVTDDGRGIDPQKVREKALKTGFLSEARLSMMTAKELVMLVCAPGFSLADKVTDISGRGVGMDVVKSVISGLGGSFHIESVPGRGTTMRAELPRSSSIMKVLTLKASGETFALHIPKVEKVFEVSGKDLALASLEYNDSTIPAVHIEDIFDIPRDKMAGGEHMAVVLGYYGDGRARRVAVIFDSFEDEIEAYIHPLSPPFAGIWGALGYTILGDGRPVFLLDAADVARAASSWAVHA